MGRTRPQPQRRKRRKKRLLPNKRGPSLGKTDTFELRVQRPGSQETFGIWRTEEVESERDDMKIYIWQEKTSWAIEKTKH
jgi:hypothetical protein